MKKQIQHEWKKPQIKLFNDLNNYLIDSYPGPELSHFPYHLTLDIIKKTKEIFKHEPVQLHINSPVYVIGDIHGQFLDLLRIFESCQYPPNGSFLFLGDYVDRGLQGVEVLLFLFLLKLRFPNQIFILRGNHEDENICKEYGFFSECSKKYTKNAKKIFDSFCSAFTYLPISAIIDEKIFCIHGGLSPDVKNLKVLDSLKKPIIVDHSKIVSDLLWTDPHFDEKGGWQGNFRGATLSYGQKVFEKFMKTNKLSLMLRAHQAVISGCGEWFDDKLLSIFSCPNYLGYTNNRGAIVKIEKNGEYKITFFEPELDYVEKQFVKSDRQLLDHSEFFRKLGKGSSHMENIIRCHSYATMKVEKEKENDEEQQKVHVEENSPSDSVDFEETVEYSEGSPRNRNDYHDVDDEDDEDFDIHL